MSRTLFLMSASIAAYKACQVISSLVQSGDEVEIAVTPGALKFVGLATLEGLTGRPVFHDLWREGRVMDHIALTRWADRAVLCPASANTLARLALGLADDPVGALALAWPAGKPFHVFPAMNTRMFEAEPTRAHIRALRTRGFLVDEPAAGPLACGESGAGRLPEPDAILRRLAAAPNKGRVLITGGATREPIDGIRYVSNVSTGRTASEIADHLAMAGWDVTVLHGTDARTPERARRLIEFTDCANLQGRLRELTSGETWSAVIHAAAVGDYRVSDANPDIKMSSFETERQLKLVANPKVLPLIKEYSADKRTKVIGFKLTLNAAPDETLRRARELLGPGVDAVVANDWGQVSADRRLHPGRFVTAGGATVFQDTHELAMRIDEFLRAGGD